MGGGSVGRSGGNDGASGPEGAQSTTHTTRTHHRPTPKNKNKARGYLRTACASAPPGAVEPHFNAALLAWRRGDLTEALDRSRAALASSPGHGPSEELLRRVRERLVAP